MDIRIGHGYDVHALAEGLPLYLGGVKVEHTKGVAIHAICDALLGALALGDIGKLFPDTSAEFKGIDSKILLRRVCDVVEEQGYSISNVDCTIAMQRPKLRPHIAQMEQNIALALNLETARVNVKATTEERLGFTGEELGMACHAVCLLEE